MTNAYAAAWPILAVAWALRWALILGVGAAPYLLARLSRLFGRDFVPPPTMRQLCALGALVLSLYSTLLLVDTYRVESLDDDAFTELTCSAVQEDVVTCEDGNTYRWKHLGGLKKGTLVVLATTKHPVLFRP